MRTRDAFDRTTARLLAQRVKKKFTNPEEDIANVRVMANGVAATGGQVYNADVAGHRPGTVVKAINMGSKAKAHYVAQFGNSDGNGLRTGGTVSVVSGGGGSGGGSGISFSEADTRYYTKVQLDAGQLDIRYYTESELDAGALDTRYFTESESDARFVPLTRTVTGTGALGGGGALSANQAITMNTPGSLTATSTNASATNHTHAIDSTIARSAITIGVSGLGLSGGGNLTANRTITLTSSSNPGAAASILASTVAGGLTLTTLTTTGAISGAANTNTAHLLGYATVGSVGFGGFGGIAANGWATTTGYMAAQNDTDGTVYLNSPASINHRISNSNVMSMVSTGLSFNDGKTVGSSGYVSGWAGSGWRADQNLSVTGQSFAEFDNLSIRGTLSVYELVINQIRATNGTLIVSSAGKIDSVSGSNWTFEDPNGSNLCAFAVDDLVIIQSVDVNASTIVKRVVRKVSAVSGKTITVTTASGAPADTGTAVAGDTVVRIGNTSNATRQGVVLLTSDMSNSPYEDVVSGVTSWADWTGGAKTKIRLGNLSGITGNANEYGLIAGTSGFTTADQWAKFSSLGVSLNKVDIASRNGSTLTISLQSDGDVFFGSNAAAAATTSFAHFATSQTFGGEVMDSGDIVIGNKSAGHMFWDASAGTLNFRDNTTVQAYVNAGGEIVAGGGNVVMNSTALTVGSNVTMNGSGLTLPVHTYSTEPSPTGGTLSTSDPKRIHQGNLELASYTVDFDPLTGRRTGATIRHVAPSVTDFLSGGFSYTGSYSRLLLETVGYYGAAVENSYIDMWAGNDSNIRRGFINIVAKDYVQITAPILAQPDADAVHTFGRAKIGYDGNTDRAAFAHYDHMSVSSRALEQTSDGTVIMNCAAATSLQFKIGNTNYLYLTTAGFRVGGSSSPTEALDVTGNIKASGTIKTTLGSAWDLGAYTASAPSATGYVTIKIGGTTYKLLAST